MKINKIIFLALIGLIFLYSPIAKSDTGYKYYNGNIVKWSKRTLEICLTEEAQTIPGIIEAAEYSSSLWNQVPSIPQTYLSLNGEVCDIKVDYIYLPPDWEIPPLAINTLTSLGNGDLLQANIDFNKKYAGKVGNPKKKRVYDLFSVFSHELGHALGLDEEKRDQSSIMYEFFETGTDKKRRLMPSDIRSITKLYRGDF